MKNGNNQWANPVAWIKKGVGNSNFVAEYREIRIILEGGCKKQTDQKVQNYVRPEW